MGKSCIYDLGSAGNMVLWYYQCPVDGVMVVGVS